MNLLLLTMTKFACLYKPRLFSYYHSMNNTILIYKLIKYTNKNMGLLLYLLLTEVFLFSLINEILGHFLKIYLFIYWRKISNITDVGRSN